MTKEDKLAAKSTPEDPKYSGLFILGSSTLLGSASFGSTATGRILIVPRPGQ